MRRHQLALGMILCLPAFGCVSRAAYTEKVDELRQCKAQLRSVGDLAQQYGDQLAELEQSRDSLESQNNMLRSSNDEATRRIDDLMAQMESMNQGPSLPEGVTTKMDASAFTYEVDGGFLFDPGKSDLKPSAKKTLMDLAGRLREHDFKIEVAGHTDTDPVAKTIKLFPRGNIELGAMRAISVWSALKASGVPEDRMRVSSYGPHLPVRAGDKAANRRVEIRVLLQEAAAQQ